MLRHGESRTFTGHSWRAQLPDNQRMAMSKGEFADSPTHVAGEAERFNAQNLTPPE